METIAGIAILVVPAFVWRVRNIGLAEIYRRIAGELLARAEARDAYDAALKSGRGKVARLEAG